LRDLLKRAGWKRGELIDAWNAHLLFGHDTRPTGRAERVKPVRRTGSVGRGQERWPEERLLWELKLRETNRTTPHCSRGYVPSSSPRESRTASPCSLTTEHAPARHVGERRGLARR